MINSQLLRTAAATLRRRSFATGVSRNNSNPHTNYNRNRHDKGNAKGLVVVGTVAIVAGTASAVAMAYCEESKPATIIAMSPAEPTPTVVSLPIEPWQMELECK